MRYRHILSRAFVAILLIGCHLAVIAQEVSVKLNDGPVTNGSIVKGTLLLSIPEGLHVNSSKPSSEYLIPTSVRFSGEGIKLGKIDYPSGKNRKFQFSASELNVYEGDIALPFSVFILKGFKGKRISMTATVSYQACTDEVCYRPENKEIVMTAQAK